MSEEKRHHVYRPRLPWRSAALTECGRSADPDTTITAGELWKRVKRDGKQRTALFICMTCWEHTGRTLDWASNPVGVLHREITRVRVPLTPVAGGNPAFTEDQKVLINELRAITALVEAHPDEFQGYLEGLANVSELDQARRNRKAR